MKFKFCYRLITLVALVEVVSSAPFFKRAVDPALVPEFGLQAGLNPTGTGDCDGVPGANGQPIKIPCSCPPDRAAFIAALDANVEAGRAVNNPSVAVSFPTDDSKASRLARMTTAIVTLQNLRGPGVGCPAASTTFVAQQRAIQDGPDTPAPAPPPPPAAPAPAPPAQNPAPAPAPPADASIAALAPSLGFQSGVNPTGTGDCDGAVNGPNGSPVKVPCTCPPDQPSFVAALEANIAAGRVINNPNVPFSFPRDDARQSQIARIQASLVTLQNLRGPGVGCPAASTTLSSQLAALQ